MKDLNIDSIKTKKSTRIPNAINELFLTADNLFANENT